MAITNSGNGLSVTKNCKDLYLDDDRSASQVQTAPAASMAPNKSMLGPSLPKKTITTMNPAPYNLIATVQGIN